MKLNGNAIRPGMILLHKDKLYKAVKIQHVKPGKGGAYAQVELKDIISGNKLNERFRSDENVERVTLEQKECLFSYVNGDEYVFMDNTTYEEIIINSSDIDKEQLPYIKEGLNLIIELYEEKPVGIILPKTLVHEVKDTEAVIKGQTASSSYKPAILDNGVRIMVPPHIEIGTRIVINTETSEYLEREKEKK